MTSKLFKTVKKKAGRLQDIVSVLQKLEEKKYVERLSKIFEEIFLEEQKFTITELQRIMSIKPTNKYMDLDEQFKQNTQLFKANFEVINGILINEIWDSVTNSFQKQDKTPSQQPVERGRHLPLQEEAQQYSHNIEGGENNSQGHQDGGEQQQNIQQQEDENEVHYESNPGVSSPGYQSDSKVLSRLGVSRSQVVNNSSTGHLNNNNNTSNYSGNNSFAGQQDNWVRNNMKKRNSSRSQENLKQQGQTPTNDSQYGKRMNSMNNSSIQNKQSQSILDIKRQSEKKLSNMNLSVSSVKSLSQSKLGIASPFSELQESKNPLQTSFSRAQRRLMDKELSQSPGPTDYKIDSADKLVRKTSPKASIGNTKRTNFIDEKQRIESCSQTPGPQYNVSQTAIYKPMKK